MSSITKNRNLIVKEIFTQNYIIPTLTIRLKYEKVSKIIQKWWRKLIKGYFQVIIILYYDDGFSHIHKKMNHGLYAYGRIKNLFNVESINNNTELQIFPKSYHNIINIWKELYDSLKHEMLYNDNKNRHKYYFRVIGRYNMIPYIWEDRIVFDYDDNNTLIIDNQYEDNDEKIIEEVNNQFINKCREYISPNI